MKNQWKRFLSLFLCLMLLTAGFSSTCLAASKTSGKCGKHATWSYNKKKKTLTISGKGEIKDTWSKYIGAKRVNVVIKEGITTIGKDAFVETWYIKKLSLPNSLTTIKEAAFGGVLDCETPSTITIPKNVKKIGRYAFSSCDGTKKFKVDKENKYFSAKDGVLFNKEKTVLIQYPPKKKGNYTIPNGVKTISYNAFDSCELKKLIVPASVKTAKESAFTCAYIKNLWFEGHIPSGPGLVDELLTEDDEAVWITRITYPEEYFDEWREFELKVKKENKALDLEWYYWWYED